MGMAEGFFHEFQGWVVFMCSAAILFGEIVLLSRIGRDAGPWRERFGIESTSAVRLPARQWLVTTPLSRGLVVASACAVVVAAIGMALPQRTEAKQPRASLVDFPMTLAEWHGRRSALDQVYVEELKFDDYLLADFQVDGTPINFYVAYYDTQRKGESAHSPRSCIPGGGWEIVDIQSETMTVDGASLPFKRVVIEKGQYRQVVYYWFVQRGRLVTNEYLVKWYIFWDSLTRNRTDGAMIRLVGAQLPGQAVEDVDRALQEFARAAAPKLNGFIPG
jgi:EpsI family protein